MKSGDYSARPESWRSALHYAAAVTPTGGEASDEIFAALARDWTAEEIVEITAVIGLFNYFNRFAEALRIPVTR